MIWYYEVEAKAGPNDNVLVNAGTIEGPENLAGIKYLEKKKEISKYIKKTSGYKNMMFSTTTLKKFF